MLMTPSRERRCIATLSDPKAAESCKILSAMHLPVKIQGRDYDGCVILKKKAHMAKMWYNLEPELFEKSPTVYHAHVERDFLGVFRIRRHVIVGVSEVSLAQPHVHHRMQTTQPCAIISISSVTFATLCNHLHLICNYCNSSLLQQLGMLIFLQRLLAAGHWTKWQRRF